MTRTARPSMVDPRGLRFAAWITTAVLAGVMLTHSATLLTLQGLVFALGAAGHSPYGAVWKRIPKSPPTELEDPRPPRFAQLVGFGFTAIGAASFFAGAVTLGIVATAAALVAAFLNAAFGYCLGCETYLLVKRSTNKGATA